MFKRLNNIANGRIVYLICIGSIISIVLLVLVLSFSFFVLNNSFVIPRILIAAGILLYLLTVLLFIRKQIFDIAAWLLIFLFSAIAFYILVEWSINAPVGILTLGFVIFLSGALFGSRHIVMVTGGSILLLILIQSFTALRIINPDVSSLATQPHFGDVLGYGTIFGIFALIAIIVGRQKEEALKNVKAAELELQKERDSLEIKLEERTASLKEAQLEEIRQLHRFAELGQITSVILHELANNLSILNLDIDSLKERHKNSSSIKRAQESIKYLDLIVDRVRVQLRENNQKIYFKISDICTETLKTLEPRFQSNRIKIKVKDLISPKHYVRGDPFRFSQILTILINNSVDAYINSNSNKNRSIAIELKSNNNEINISVKDYGPGIPANVRSAIFQPIRSSKHNGLGVGLYIAKQIVETHFKGKLALNASKDYTEFTIALPTTRKTNSPKHSTHSQLDL